VDRKVIIFKLGNEEFAFDIHQVERILGYIEPTKVPEAPFFVEGVINYQNTILPIISLRKKFNMNYEDSKDKKIIVVKNNNKIVGLLVDTVLEVTDIKEENIETSPDIVTVEKNKYIQSIIRLDNRIILNIDTEKILTKDELEKITN